MEQMNLFTWQNEDYVIPNKVRLIELFSGIGAQHKSLSILKEFCEDVDFEMWRTCDWTISSIKAYNDIHIKDYTDYSVGKTHEEIVNACMGVSANENEPLTREKLSKRKDLKEIYNSIIATHNLVNIQNVKGKDLEIVDTDKYTYLMTYSFPCQDISLAGKQAGVKVGTRSGMLFEVERILDELKSLSLCLPQILIMENVDMLLSETNGNLATFNEWQRKLDSLGYTSFCKVLNAKNYGIPQNRKRVFLVSILGQWEYLFPSKMKLKYELKDFLDNNVDESYYLSPKMINYISATGTKDYKCDSKINLGVARCITTEPNKRAGITDYIGDDLEENCDLQKLVYSPKCLNDTIEQNETFIAVKNATEQGYLLAEEGDGVDISSRMEKHRGTVQKGSCQTLTTQCNVGVVVKETLKAKQCNEYIERDLVKENDIINHSRSTDRLSQMDNGVVRTESENGLCPTLTSRSDCLGVVVKDKEYKRYENYVSWKNNQGEFNTQCNRASLLDDLSPTVATMGEEKVCDITREQYQKGKTPLRIRKLTERECYALMGFEKKDCDNVKESKAEKYRQAGDSIVSTVLVAIIGKLYGLTNEKIHEIINNYVDRLVKEK